MLYGGGRRPPSCVERDGERRRAERLQLCWGVGGVSESDGGGAAGAGPLAPVCVRACACGRNETDRSR